MKGKSNALLRYLSENGLKIFRSEQLADHFPKMDQTAYELLEDMARRRLLVKLKKGLYARVPQDNQWTSYMPDWHKTAEAYLYQKAHYIGFYSALQIHELVTQPSLSEFVVVTHRVQPKLQRIGTAQFEFIHFQPKRFFGFEKTWINDHDKVYCSNIEKTLIDCIYMPQYAGGIEGIVKATFKARHKIRANILVDYALQFNVKSVVKRLGYILDKLDLFEVERRILRHVITASHTRLDPSIDAKGKYVSKWKVIENVGIDDIIKTIST
jgi:predicted transcriptional regulator of viral defense system